MPSICLMNKKNNLKGILFKKNIYLLHNKILKVLDKTDYVTGCYETKFKDNCIE